MEMAICLFCPIDVYLSCLLKKKKCKVEIDFDY